MIAAVPRKVPDRFAETDLNGETVLMNIDTGQFHALKNTGLAIWRLIDGVRSIAAIQAELLKIYDVDDAQCQAETFRFLNALKESGFVEGF